MFLTTVGSPRKPYRKNLFLLADFNILSPTHNPTLWQSTASINARLCITHYGFQIPYSSHPGELSPVHPLLSPSPTPRGNVPCIFLAPGLCSHCILQLECLPSLCLILILYLLPGWTKPLSSTKVSLGNTICSVFLNHSNIVWWLSYNRAVYKKLWKPRWEQRWGWGKG